MTIKFKASPMLLTKLSKIDTDIRERNFARIAAFFSINCCWRESLESRLSKYNEIRSRYLPGRSSRSCVTVEMPGTYCQLSEAAGVVAE
jgi:hypothetical protein